jgi:hypothetical protein
MDAARTAADLNTTDLNTTLDEALKDFTSVLAADGYTSEREIDGDGRLRIQILATDAACADCLVPKVVLEAILSAALAGTGLELADVRLPAEAA